MVRHGMVQCFQGLWHLAVGTSRGLCHVYSCHLHINRDTAGLCPRQTRRQQIATPCTVLPLVIFCSPVGDLDPDQRPRGPGSVP